jgi:hypothetical protein
LAPRGDGVGASCHGAQCVGCACKNSLPSLFCPPIVMVPMHTMGTCTTSEGEFRKRKAFPRVTTQSGALHQAPCKSSSRCQLAIGDLSLYVHHWDFGSTVPCADSWPREELILNVSSGMHLKLGRPLQAVAAPSTTRLIVCTAPANPSCRGSDTSWCRAGDQRSYPTCLRLPLKMACHEFVMRASRPVLVLPCVRRASTVCDPVTPAKVPHARGYPELLQAYSVCCEQDKARTCDAPWHSTQATVPPPCPPCRLCAQSMESPLLQLAAACSTLTRSQDR